MVRKLKKIFIYVSIVFFTLSGIYFYHRSFKAQQAIPEEKVLEEKEAGGPLVPVFRKEYDLENNEGVENAGVISDTKASSGRNSCELNAEREYGITLLYPVESIQGAVGLSNLKLTAAIWTIDPGEAQWVMEIMDPQNKSVSWSSELIAMRKLQWDTLEFFFDLPKDLMKKGYLIKLYPWNKSLKQLWIDNISVTIIGRSITDQNEPDTFLQVNYLYDFETADGLTGDPKLSEDFSHSGKRSALLNGSNSYSPSVIKLLSEVCIDSLKSVAASVWLYPEDKNPDAVLALSIDDVNGVNKFWSGKSTDKMQLESNKWHKLNAVFGIPIENRNALKADDKLTIYVWNRSSMKVYVDDLEIVYGEEGDRPGRYPFADMNLSSRSSYTFDRYHPPFRISYSSGIDWQNEQSPFLIADSKIKLAELFPKQEIIALKSGPDKPDILLTHSQGSFEFISWCTIQKRFYLAGKTPKIPFEKTDLQLLAVDIDGDGVSEILEVQGSKARLLKYNVQSLSDCSNNLSEINLQVLWQDEVEQNLLFSIDNFDNDSKQEWLSVDKKSNAWKIRKYVDGKFSIISRGNLQGKNISNKEDLICGKFLSPISNVQLLINGSNDTDPVFAAYEYSSFSKNFKSIITNRTAELGTIFKTGKRMFKLSSPAKVQDDVLLIDLTNKFSIHLIKSDKQGFFVHSQVEFKGYKDDQNPKYYEMVKPIIGNYISSIENNLLLVLRNCSDEYFDGKNCNEFGGSTDLPDQIQLYSLKFE